MDKRTSVLEEKFDYSHQSNKYFDLIRKHEDKR